METKAILEKPYTEEEKIEFIVKYNHNLGLTIEETETELQALGYTTEELQQQEAEKTAKLSLTKREVFLAIYQDKGITPEEIRAQITDTAALIEFDYAEKYYRGNPLIDLLGASLGYTKEQLDYLFEKKSLQETIPSKEIDFWS